MSFAAFLCSLSQSVGQILFRTSIERISARNIIVHEAIPFSLRTLARYDRFHLLLFCVDNYRQEIIGRNETKFSKKKTPQPKC